MSRAAFHYSPQFTRYKFSDRHPLRQERLGMVDQLLQAYGVYDSGALERVEPAPLDPEWLRRVHTDEYLDALRRLSDGKPVAEMREFGFGPGDNPPFPGMWEASLLYAGASLDAAYRVLHGENRYAFNSSGGLHHAFPDRASGFCLVNDNAVAAYAALDMGLRVCYIDIDAHHGDGTQACFYDNPDVLTLSLHETGRALFPGTGFTGETGIGAGEGFSVNVPMAPYSTDEHYAYAMGEIVEPVARAYDAHFIILNVGADSISGDPITHLRNSMRGYIDMVRRVLALAGERPLICLGGGGYNVPHVVRAWTLLTAELAGVALPDEVPAAYAAAYPQITRLHNDAPPQITDAQRAEGWRQVRQSVAELKGGLIGERYGLK